MEDQASLQAASDSPLTGANFMIPTPPPPSEGWSLADPPATATQHVSYVVVPAEQMRQMLAATEWARSNTQQVERQTQVIEALEQKVERATAASERNATSFESMKASAAAQAQAAAKMAEDLLKPTQRTPTTSTELAEALLIRLAPAMPNATPEATVDRVRALIARFRLFYPAVSTPAPR